MSLTKIYLPLVFCFFLFIPSFVWPASAQFECGQAADTTTQPFVSKIGVAKAVVIYATWDSTANPKKDTLPNWWARVWDTARQLSVPKFYKDNSLGKYSLQTVPHGKGTVRCFSSPIKPLRPYVQAAFNEDILRQADDSINFANFDANGDHIVDGVFIVIINYLPTGGSLLILTNNEFVTHDSVAGQPIKISRFQGTAQFATSEELAVTVCCHEWGHVLGAGDWYGSVADGSNTCWGLGGFSIMANGFWNSRAVPFDPWNRIQFGWITPTNVTQPIFGQSLSNCLTTGIVYRLPVPDDSTIGFTGQYFLVTNHLGVNPNLDSVERWEEFFPGNGLLIWHVGGEGWCSTPPPVPVDLELPHGMYQYVIGSSIPCSLTVSDSSTVQGRDSLDLRCYRHDSLANCLADCGWDFTIGIGTGTCFWNQTTKRNFDGKSNPSSDAWKSIPFSLPKQIFSSHIGVRNASATLFQSATADLLINNWFGHITANTTWGPGAYAITGDVTVDAGKTLTIAPGTTIYFQKNEDNQASGLDVERSELIVADGGTLVAVGSASSPIKFLSSSSNPFFDEWHGIRVYGSAKFSKCQFKNAYAALDFQNTAYDTVRGCVFQNNEYFGLQARNSNVYIVQDTFKNNGMGVCFDPASAVIESCYFKDNYIGIYTLRSFGRISHNRIIGSCYLSGSGLHAEGYVAGADQFLRFNNNTVSGQFLQGGVIANARVRVDSCKVNINKQVCPPVPEDPPLNRAFQAFSVDSAISRFSVLSVAGYSSGTIPPVVEIGPSTPANLGCVGTADSGYNTILRSGSGKAVVNFGSAADSAQKNYWGTAAPDSATIFSGPLTFRPFLTSQPSPPIAPRVIDQDKSGNTPLRYSLTQNYPNPFNPTTTIRFSLPQAGRATLTVYNLLGQQVAKLWEGEKPAGVHAFVWDGRDEKGSGVSSGIYFYKLEATGFKEVKRMVFLK